MKSGYTTIRIIAIMALVMGLIQLVQAVEAYLHYAERIGQGIAVQGVYVEVGEEKAYISYEAEESTYVTETKYFRSSTDAGDSVMVYYLPDQIADAQPAEKWMWAERMIVGGVFTIIGAVFAIIVCRRDRKRISLEKNGVRVWAQVIEISQNPFIRINRRSPYVVQAECRHPLTGNMILVKSEFITRCPKVSEGDTVEVLLDLNDESRYYMPVDRL